MKDSTTKSAPPHAGFETTDVHPHGVSLAALGLIVFCALLLLGIAVLYRVLASHHGKAERDTAGEHVALSVAQSVRQIPGPRLQVVPEADLATMRMRDEEELNRYGWIDKQAGLVQIPLERAIQLIAQRGLPVRGQPGVPIPTRTLLDLQQARPMERNTPKEQPTK